MNLVPSAARVPGAGPVVIVLAFFLMAGLIGEFELQLTRSAPRWFSVTSEQPWLVEVHLGGADETGDKLVDRFVVGNPSANRPAQLCRSS